MRERMVSLFELLAAMHFDTDDALKECSCSKPTAHAKAVEEPLVDATQRRASPQRRGYRHRRVAP